MTSPSEPSKQDTANRENGKKGGVKTADGKAISSQNAKVHGILSLRIFPEEQEEYLYIYNKLKDELKPTTVIEQVLIERVAFHVIQMQRVSFARNEYLLHRKYPRKVIEHDLWKLSETIGIKTEVLDEGYSPQISEYEVEHLLDLYHRYEVAVENRFYKSVRELSQLRRAT